MLGGHFRDGRPESGGVPIIQHPDVWKSSGHLEGFADLMGAMWPELISAMPLGMGKMMRLMGKIPGALNLMKPMFGILFPMLLPRMMPKVMPVMLEKIGEKIPMPDYMAEQMPEMMPGIMDNLMPHMIKEVVPLVTGPMIDYLKGK